MFVKIKFAKTDCVKKLKCLVAVRATVASGVKETNQGRISPKFYVESMRDQRVAPVLEHIKIKYYGQKNNTVTKFKQ